VFVIGKGTSFMPKHITHVEISVEIYAEIYGDNPRLLAYVYESIFVSQIASRPGAQTDDGEEVIVACRF
jgi:hypothetical protein